MSKFKACLAKTFFILLLITGLLIANVDSSYAQKAGQVTLTAIPPRAGTEELLKGKPGEKLQTQIRVRNNSDEAISVETIIKDYIVKDDGVTPIPVEENLSNRWSLASWMVVTPNRHMLAPREIAQLNVLIEIPEDALPGGHYAMVLHRPANLISDQNEQSASAISQQVGTLFYVIVDGPINEEAYLRGLSFKKFQEFGPVPFSFQVDNQSDIHISPSFRIDIFNMFNQQIDTFTVETQNVFPFTSRNFDGSWRKEWGFGKYKAQVTMSFGENGNIAIASTYFWILPITLIIAILLVILVVISIIVAIKKHLQDKQQATQAQVNDLQQKIDQLEQNKQNGSNQRPL